MDLEKDASAPACLVCGGRTHYVGHGYGGKAKYECDRCGEIIYDAGPPERDTRDTYPMDLEAGPPGHVDDETYREGVEGLLGLNAADEPAGSGDRNITDLEDEYLG